MPPIITIFCSFTRPWAVDRWLAGFDGVKHDRGLINLVFIIDGNQPVIRGKLSRFAAEREYRSVQIVMNTEFSPNEVRIAARRLRIADIKNQSKKLIAETDGNYIISFEDDTVLERFNTFDTLIEPLQRYEDVGFVEGVQCGRWGAKLIGAWQFDDFEFPQKAWTLLPGRGYQEIDAGGFYGYATRRDVYLEHVYYWETSQPWGPDVNFGLWLRQNGYRCMIHWPSVFGHNDFDNILWPENNLGRVEYTKDNVTSKWDRTDLVKTP